MLFCELAATVRACGLGLAFGLRGFAPVPFAPFFFDGSAACSLHGGVSALGASCAATALQAMPMAQCPERLGGRHSGTTDLCVCVQEPTPDAFCAHR